MAITNKQLGIVAVLMVAIAGAEYYQYKATTPKSSPSQAQSQSVSAAQLGNEWPLRVTSGKVYCELGARYVFEDPNGQRWGINGMANAVYPEIRPLLLDNPNPALACRPDESNCVTPKMSLSPLFDIAERLCK